MWKKFVLIALIGVVALVGCKNKNPTGSQRKTADLVNESYTLTTLGSGRVNVWTLMVNQGDTLVVDILKTSGERDSLIASIEDNTYADVVYAHYCDGAQWTLSVGSRVPYYCFTSNTSSTDMTINVHITRIWWE